jgi:FixJ family two-component response regulator
VIQRRPSKQIDAPETPVVLVVDDDPSLREALGRLFRSVDLESRLFSSVAELLLQKFPDVPCCLVLDIRLPGVSGLDFQTQLANSNIHVPIIMMTGHGDIPMSVRAMKGGAVDFLTKPFRDQDMLDAVAQAIERDRKRRDSDKTDEAESIRTVHEAVDRGITLIDTAPAYGFGRPEEIVGRALAEGGRRKQVLIATKVGLDWKDGQPFRNASKARIHKEIEDSLRRLSALLYRTRQRKHFATSLAIKKAVTAKRVIGELPSSSARQEKRITRACCDARTMVPSCRAKTIPISEPALVVRRAERRGLRWPLIR